jgi:hypothetical protein
VSEIYKCCHKWVAERGCVQGSGGDQGRGDCGQHQGFEERKLREGNTTEVPPLSRGQQESTDGAQKATKKVKMKGIDRGRVNSSTATPLSPSEIANASKGDVLVTLQMQHNDNLDNTDRILQGI